MNKSFPWFRLYAADLLNDRKIKRINRATGLTLAEIRGAWLTILCLASESPERGKIMMSGGIPYNFDEIADEIGMDDARTIALFNHLKSMNMVAFEQSEQCYYLPNWGKRQFTSDNSTERVRKFRAKQKQQAETLQKRFGNAIEEESEEETEAEGATPSLFSALMDAFCKSTGIPEILMTGKDVETIKTWVQAEYQPAEVKAATEQLLAKGFSISGPSSLNNALKIVRANAAKVKQAQKINGRPLPEGV